MARASSCRTKMEKLARCPQVAVAPAPVAAWYPLGPHPSTTSGEGAFHLTYGFVIGWSENISNVDTARGLTCGLGLFLHNRASRVNNIYRIPGAPKKKVENIMSAIQSVK